MTRDDGIRPRLLPSPVRLTWRRSRDATRISVLVIGLMVVFLLSMAHDEIVAALVADDWLAAGFAEKAEILFGLVLFVIWGGLTVALVDTFRRSARPGRPDSLEGRR